MLSVMIPPLFAFLSAHLYALSPSPPKKRKPTKQTKSVVNLSVQFSRLRKYESLPQVPCIPGPLMVCQSGIACPLLCPRSVSGMSVRYCMPAIVSQVRQWYVSPVLHACYCVPGPSVVCQSGIACLLLCPRSVSGMSVRYCLPAIMSQVHWWCVSPLCQVGIMFHVRCRMECQCGTPNLFPRSVVGGCVGPVLPGLFPRSIVGGCVGPVLPNSFPRSVDGVSFRYSKPVVSRVRCRMVCQFPHSMPIVSQIQLQCCHLR